MAGLAATLNAPGLIEALAVALAARGADGAVCRLESSPDSTHDGSSDGSLDGSPVRLAVAVRAALPTIARVADDDGRTIAAFGIDGVASITALDAGYAAAGPAGLLRGEDAVTVVLADADRGILVLARDGDGPGLYYTRHRGGWLVASEPGALVAAGVPPAPHVETISRFVRSGACDDTAQTFLDGVWRVLADRPVVLTAGGADPVPVAETLALPLPPREATDRAPPSARESLAEAVRQPRVGVLLAPGRPGAALLGSALAAGGRADPLPVYTTAVTTRAEANAVNQLDLDGAGRTSPAVIRSPKGTIRHTAHVVDLGAVDLDMFLRELGEPVPDLDFYLLWAVTRDPGCDVDVVVDASTGDPSCVARVRDRVVSRYGIDVRCPLRGVDGGDLGPATVTEAASDAGGQGAAGQGAAGQGAAVRGVAVHGAAGQGAAAGQGSVNGARAPGAEDHARAPGARDRHARAPGTPVGAGYPVIEVGEPVTVAGVLLSNLDAVASALATPRPWTDPAANVRSLRRLHRGEPADEGLLFRAYLVERWMLGLPPGPAGGLAGGPGQQDEQVARPDDIDVDGAAWARLPVRTEAFAPGDRLAPSAAWHIVDAVTRLCADRPDRQAMLGPWFVVVSAKVVAVSQRRVSPLWQIRPGVSARLLARVARRGLPWLGEAWTMQVAIDEGGLLPVAAGTVAAGLGHSGWAARLLPEQAALLSPARADAVAPANACVVSSPFRPDDAAEVILEALRHALPPGPLDTLAGCAVVSADEAGSRVLGFAAGPYIDAVPDAETTLAEVLADNPCGQGQQRTPIVLAFRAL